MKNWTIVFQFKNGRAIALMKIPMEKVSNAMQFIGCQLFLLLIFAGTVHGSHGMALQRAIIDRRMKFWEYGQLYVARSAVNSPDDLCILLPDDMNDFTIHPAVDVDVVQILETMQSSRPLSIPKFRLVTTSSPALMPSIHLTQLYQTNYLAPTITSTLPRIKFVMFPVSIMMLLKHLIPTRLRYVSIFRSCHGSLRTNRCLDLTASEISSLKSLSPNLLCLLRHFSIEYFKPAAQNSYWYRITDYHSGWNDHSWILSSKPEYCSLNSLWLITFIVNTIFVNHQHLTWSMR
jgi:hypothetical protein